MTVDDLIKYCDHHDCEMSDNCKLRCICYKDIVYWDDYADEEIPTTEEECETI